MSTITSMKKGREKVHKNYNNKKQKILAQGQFFQQELMVTKAHK